MNFQPGNPRGHKQRAVGCGRVCSDLNSSGCARPREVPLATWLSLNGEGKEMK